MAHHSAATSKLFRTKSVDGEAAEIDTAQKPSFVPIATWAEEGRRSRDLPIDLSNKDQGSLTLRFLILKILPPGMGAYDVWHQTAVLNIERADEKRSHVKVVALDTLTYQ